MALRPYWNQNLHRAELRGLTKSFNPYVTPSRVTTYFVCWETMIMDKWTRIVVLLACCNFTGCAADSLSGIGGGLDVRLLNPPVAASAVRLQLDRTNVSLADDLSPITQPETRVLLSDIASGAITLRVTTLSGGGVPLGRVTIDGIQILTGQVTALTIDLLEDAEPIDPPLCDDTLPAPICGTCTDGIYSQLVDDDRCGVISCAAFEGFRLEGDNQFDGISSCLASETEDITEDRCLSLGECIEASTQHCPTTDSTILEAQLCELIVDCGLGTPLLEIAPDGTPCDLGFSCRSGDCIEDAIPTPEPEPEPDPIAGIGCADGSREGFQNQSVYPHIAACSGAWSEGGVTRTSAAASCNREAGNDGNRADGLGCAASDLCMEGWHICRGHTEVGLRAPSGCGDALPPGTPDKSLFFAVSQNSTASSQCDTSSNGNDIFGCGNLGSALSSDQECGVLNRVLASMQANSCGFNEAEPPLGPWVCRGDTESHLAEGTLVQKNGCPGGSCAYDGRSVANWDKGGVLCCAD